jgi:hypothetical protein
MNLVWYMLDTGPNAGSLRPAVICDYVSADVVANLVVFTLGLADGAVWRKTATPVMNAEWHSEACGEECWVGGTRG